LSTTPEKKASAASPQFTEIISGSEKNVFSEKPGEQREWEQIKTSLAHDKQGLEVGAKGVIFLRDVLRETALLAIGIVACLVFIFSFRTYHIVQVCYPMMIRLQAGRKNSQ
jgi:hypothetical protein